MTTDTPQSRILLVDDEPAVVSTLQLALADDGLVVDTATSAEEGLAMMRVASYDLLLVDKNLPGMSGVELLREVRAQHPGVRTFLITGYASVDAAMETLHLGVEGFIEKPFDDIFKVVEQVKAALARPARRRKPISVGKARTHFSKATMVLQAASMAHSADQDLRIVIASPDDDERTWLQRHLSGGHDVVDVMAALPEVVRVVEAGPPDVLVLDAELDETGLFELLERLRDKPMTVTVVAARKPSLSAIVRLIDLGVRAVIEKPFEERNVRVKLDSLLAAAREGKAELRRTGRGGAS